MGFYLIHAAILIILYLEMYFYIIIVKNNVKKGRFNADQVGSCCNISEKMFLI